MNYRNDESTCTIDNWFCNGAIPCNECPTALEHLRTFWEGWAELRGYSQKIELVKNGESVDVFVRKE